MGFTAPKACRNRLCGTTTTHASGFCESCFKKQRAASDKRRGSAHQRGYTVRWSRESRRFLDANPLCRTCEAQNIIQSAEVTDHIKPHKGDMALFWDRSNWQPLCKRHHDEKTAKEDGGFGRGRGV